MMVITFLLSVLFFFFFVFAFRSEKCFWTFCVPNKYLKFLRKKRETWIRVKQTLKKQTLETLLLRLIGLSWTLHLLDRTMVFRSQRFEEVLMGCLKSA